MNDAWKFRNMRDSLVIRVQADTNHKSARFLSHLLSLNAWFHINNIINWQTHTILFLCKKIPYPLPFE